MENTNLNNTENTQPQRNYELNSDAIEDLAGAHSGEVPEYSEEELSKYRTKSKFGIPDWVKIIFLKAWFAGAVYYFIAWGLGLYLNLLDMIFVLCFAVGAVTDLLLNNVIRFIEPVPGYNDDWLMVTKKGVPGLLLNVLYGFVIVICVYALTYGINYTVQNFLGFPSFSLPGEPITFGLFCMGFDMLFIGIKRLIVGFIESKLRK